MAKKSKAQIERMKKRAEARGQEYRAPSPHQDEDNNARTNVAATNPTPKKDATDIAPSDPQGSKSPVDSKKLRAAAKLSNDIYTIENDSSLRSKERRSARRKAEAIAQEATGCTADELLAWYENHKDDHSQGTKGKKRKNPYIVFFGQLSYETTKESLFQHIKTELGDEHKITEDTVRIRLLTDSKTKKSRGMAFVELSDPELMYSCLKMHRTLLDGRRMNVERSAGGSRNSETRKSKLQLYRSEQEVYMATTVRKMFDEYIKSGEIQDGELDEGAIALCQRHSATVVQAGLEKYVESNGRDMDNSSAYFSFLLGKLATEGIFEDEKKTNQTDGERPRKRQVPTTRNDSEKKRPRAGSEFANQGVDMNVGSGGAYSTIFPSASRGRGRVR